MIKKLDRWQAEVAAKQSKRNIIPKQKSNNNGTIEKARIRFSSNSYENERKTNIKEVQNNIQTQKEQEQ